MLLSYKKQVYRLANILDLLIQRDRMVSIMEISKINNCTERTVYNDIYYIIENWNERIQLDFSHASIISSNTSVGNVHFIYEDIIARQPHTKLLRLLIEKPNRTIEYYGEEIKMSEQSTRKILRTINATLNTYDVKLNTRPRKFELVGSELQVRLFIASFYDNFPRSFVLPPVDVEYDDEIAKLFKVSSRFEGFLHSLESSAALRYKQGYVLEKQSNHTLEEDVRATLQQFIEAIKDTEDRTAAYIPELISILKSMGYVFDDACESYFRTILCHILYMRNNVYSVYNVYLRSVSYFIKNYARVNRNVYEVHRKAMEAVLAKITPDYEYVYENLIFNIDSIRPKVEQPQALNLMVYSDISFDHANALKTYLSSSFPLNTYYVYSGPTDLRSPRQKDLTSFVVDHECTGIISTCDFPYKINYPKVTVSSYLVGSDIGRIFDFLNDLKKPVIPDGDMT